MIRNQEFDTNIGECWRADAFGVGMGDGIDSECLISVYPGGDFRKDVPFFRNYLIDYQYFTEITVFNSSLYTYFHFPIICNYLNISNLQILSEVYECSDYQ